jgi:alkylated DNA repair dioxygenase AlkB
VPKPWSAELDALRDRVGDACGTRFDSVLANLYRDGRDSMGWHSDDEPELGPAPVIASISLGATRRFVLKQRRDGASPLSLDLPHGSLLVMSGETQRNYRHALPRSARVLAPRINLTFRTVAGRE